MTNQLNIVTQEEPEARFLAQSLEKASFPNNLENLRGKRVIFKHDFSKECLPLQPLRKSSRIEFFREIREFSPHPKEREIAAIDSSCVLVGETEEGAIYSGRVTAVRAFGRKIKTYIRFGPAIFYLEPNSMFPSLPSRLSRKIINILLLDKGLAEKFIRTQLERWLQFELSGELTQGIILIDGGLRSSDLESREFSLSEIERRSEENSNQILGISKSTNLRLISSYALELDFCRSGGVYLDITDSLKMILPKLHCRVLVAKLSANAPAFRVDCARSNLEDDSQVLSDLKHNDVIYRGYPETLRLAHHLSTLDISTVNSIRAYLSRKYEMTAVPNDDLRATVLGKLL